MRQFTDYCSIIFCVTTASTEEDRRYSLAVSSGSLPFPYPLLGDQPGQLVLPGDVRPGGVIGPQSKVKLPKKKRQKKCHKKLIRAQK